LLLVFAERIQMQQLPKVGVFLPVGISIAKSLRMLTVLKA
jgi:hypothetical protein